MRALMLITLNQKKPLPLDAIRGIKGVTKAHAVTGPYDVIASVEAEDVEAIRQISSDLCRTIDAVEKALTVIVLDL